jgi:hypothetical protein
MDGTTFGECDEQAKLMQLAVSIQGIGSAEVQKVRASSNSGANNCLDLENILIGWERRWLIMDFDISGSYKWYAFEGCCVTANSFYAVWPKKKATDDYDMLKNKLSLQQYWVKTINDIEPGQPNWQVQTVFSELPIP